MSRFEEYLEAIKIVVEGENYVSSADKFFTKEQQNALLNYFNNQEKPQKLGSPLPTYNEITSCIKVKGIYHFEISSKGSKENKNRRITISDKTVNNIIESESKGKNEMNFQKIQDIKNFIDKNYSSLNVNIPMRLMTRMDGKKWKLPNRIYGDKDKIKELYSILNTGEPPIEVSGPHGSDAKKDAFKVGNFVFQQVDDGTIEFMHADRLKKNSNVWRS